MYLTIDCAQFENNQLAFYEFCDKDNSELRSYSIEKYNLISKVGDIVYFVDYSKGKDAVTVYQSGKVYDAKSSRLYDGQIKDFNKWYLSKNLSNNVNQNPSKEFGAILSGGDPYVEKILTGLTQLNIYNDDNGRGIIIPALKGHPTYFFDVDLLSLKNNDVIEFLKNDSEEKKKTGLQPWSLTNAKTHPNRYWNRNKQKFINLYNASKRINGNLWLVNYNNDLAEKVTLIKVNSLDSTNGITDDISYLLSYEELLQWLLINDESVSDGVNFLNGKPKQVRDSNFWSRPLDICKSELGRHN
ncbi:hypothetical protein [Lactococcus lactis]|uniref:hypothetical protein n=1 Tax=Lactococcus lactis TaxID=1358 RepID=UPI0023A9E3B3|nr:hypothetical protein [Lactococcus lactis]WEA54170.1 hypothetical protein PWP91_07725 [Lactococcus lactis]